MVKIAANFRNSQMMLLPLCSFLIFTMMIAIIPATAEPCNCVIFRFVDIQDFYLSQVRIDVMDTFINEDEKVSLSIILNSVNTDTNIINKVAQGQQSEHFELTLHGYNHENISTFNLAEQKNLLTLMQQKMVNLWGVNSTSFVPPMHQWNANTQQAMSDLNIPIISAGPQGVDPPENIKFIANPPSDITDGFGNYHLPQTAEMYNHGVFPHLKISNDDIMDDVDAAIATYGYAVLNLYGTDFSEKDGSGNPTGVTNSTEITHLIDLFNRIATNGYTTTTFEEIIPESCPPLKACLTIIKNVINDDGGTNVPGDFTMVITATNPSDNNFPGENSPGTTITIDPGSFSVSESAVGGYSASFSSACDGFAIEGESFTCTVTNDDIPTTCGPPGTGDWILTDDCILSTNSVAAGNIFVQNNALLTVPSGISLGFDSAQFGLNVEFGSGVLIKSGGIIS